MSTKIGKSQQTEFLLIGNISESHFAFLITVNTIRVRYYGAFAKMNASFFSFLPAQREKSCVTRLYFLP